MMTKKRIVTAINVLTVIAMLIHVTALYLIHRASGMERIGISRISECGILFASAADF